MDMGFRMCIAASNGKYFEKQLNTIDYPVAYVLMPPPARHAPVQSVGYVKTKNRQWDGWISPADSQSEVATVHWLGAGKNSHSAGGSRG
jgi:hypothetical protein